MSEEPRDPAPESNRRREARIEEWAGKGGEQETQGGEEREGEHVVKQEQERKGGREIKEGKR